MTTAFYRTGTVAVTQNSKVVTGTGTNWTTGPTKPLAGDVFIFNNKMYEIDNVVSDTEIRLYRNFEDSTASSKSYAIMRNASLNISARIAAQVAQVVNQKQIMVDEFHDFLTNNTDSTVPLTDTLGNTIDVTPIPMLDKDYVEKIGGIDSAVNQAIQDINDAFDNFEYPVLTAAQRQAIVDANEEKFAASGIVHMGLTGSTTGLINEGLIATPIATPYANKLYLGAPEYTDNRIGTSKNEYSTQHIAGVVSEFVTGRSGDNAYSSQAIQLPPAPDGTVIYDSTGDARGTGKANLNLLTDVDPKYGDSAEDLYGVGTVTSKNEASNRAFEGEVKNGDFRLGDEFWSFPQTSRGSYSVTEGVLEVVNTVRTNSSGTANVAQSNILDFGTVYDIEVRIVELTGGATIRVGAGAASDTTGASGIVLDSVGLHKVRLSGGAASPGVLFLYCTGSVANDTSFKISEISVRPVTEEVVTDRVDMFGLEQFDMVMKDGEIFDMIQSRSSTFGTSGVPTVTSVRPDSFFAAYSGQENIVKGKCVRWPDLNRAQKRHITKYMKERLWVNEDGDLTFTTIRQHGFEGAGNGDWKNSAKRSSLAPIDQGYCLVFDNVAQPYKVQAGADSVPEASMYWTTSETTATWGDKNFKSRGLFKATRNSSGAGHLDAFNGRCFFYVLGTCSRLNQGAYHPSLNESGARAFVKSGQDWNNLWNKTEKSWTKRELFMIADVADVDNQWRVGKASGAIGTPSGRSDGRFYDAIYADGLGGVVDYRLPAYENDSPEEAAKVWEKVKNKTYRGLENPLFTRPVAGSSNGHSDDIGVYYNDGLPSENIFQLSISSSKVFEVDDFVEGVSVVSVVNNTTGEILRGTCFGVFSKTNIRFHVEIPTSERWYASDDFTDHTFLISNPIKQSVSGNFIVTDAIGNPVNFLKVEDLKFGWPGGWIPAIPDNTAKNFVATRKNVDDVVSRTYTNDYGVTWLSNTVSFDNTNNHINFNASDSTVMLWKYIAFAKQTKPSTNKPVLNSEAGLGSAWAWCYVNPEGGHGGGLLMESLIGKVGTNSSLGGELYQTLALTKSGIKGDSYLGSSALHEPDTTHSPLSLVSPNNNHSRAVKALPYQISNNGQCSLGVHANELTYEDNPTVINITSTNLNENLVAGSLYRVDRKAGSSVMDGGLYYCTTSLSSLGWDSSQWYVAADGEVKRFDNNVTYLVSATLGWGDDGTLKITASGSDTFVDLNGNTNLSVVHELALPYGWTKNRARASVQVEGVDL